MSSEDFNLCMTYLDEIEKALNTIAIAVGHPTMDVFFSL
jgi:hypothetical protein